MKDVARQMEIPYTTIQKWLSPKILNSHKEWQYRDKHDPSENKRRRDQRLSRSIDLSQRKREYKRKCYENGSGRRYWNKLKEDPERYAKFLKRKAEYNKLKREKDPTFRIRMSLSGRTWKVLVGKVSKSARTEILLGCSIRELIDHWKEQYGTDWNSCNLHIDHVRPCSSFDLTNSEQQYVCFNWRNLQLLSASENCSKGGKWTRGMEKEWIERMRSTGYCGDLYVVFPENIEE